jgi:diacylglycerol O-acyltransferase / wax synthase
VGLNITVMSYRDHIDFGIVADRNQVPDVWSLLAGAGRALEEFESVICGPRPAPAPAPETEPVAR